MSAAPTTSASPTDFTTSFNKHTNEFISINRALTYKKLGIWFIGIIVTVIFILIIVFVMKPVKSEIGLMVPIGLGYLLLIVGICGLLIGKSDSTFNKSLKEKQKDILQLIQESNIDDTTYNNANKQLKFIQNKLSIDDYYDDDDDTKRVIDTLRFKLTEIHDNNKAK